MSNDSNIMASSEIEDLRRLADTTQLQASILEKDAPHVVQTLAGLEAGLELDGDDEEEDGQRVNEWRTNIFCSTGGAQNETEKTVEKKADVDTDQPDVEVQQEVEAQQAAVSLTSREGQLVNSFFAQDPAVLSDQFSEVMRKFVKHKLADTETKPILFAAATVVRTSWELIAPRIQLLLDDVAKQLPHMLRRLKLGADVTIRRTDGKSHGKAARYERHDPSAVHTDSWDGTVLGFGLVSTKLGTPSYPVGTEFPLPISMFLSQSRTGKNDAHQLDTTKIGPLREWNPGTLVVMPAATAHSKPNRAQIDSDPTPEVPRWFCRATLRVHVGQGFWSQGKTAEAREDRLALALLVAEHVWGDANFASVGRRLAKVPFSVWGREDQASWRVGVGEKRRHLDRQDKASRANRWVMQNNKRPGMPGHPGSEHYVGETKEVTVCSGEAEEVHLVRHGVGRVTCAKGTSYDGTWKEGKKHGQGTFIWPDGRQYSGAWVDDLRTGFGVCTFPNGLSWTGEFNSGRPSDQKGYDAVQSQRPSAAPATDVAPTAGH